MPLNPEQRYGTMRIKGIIGLLLASFIFAIPGLAFIHHAVYTNIKLLGFGVLATFAGMWVGLVGSFGLGNRFVKSERAVFQADLSSSLLK
jgi:hypothetical protein